LRACEGSHSKRIACDSVNDGSRLRLLEIFSGRRRLSARTRRNELARREAANQRPPQSAKSPGNPGSYRLAERLRRIARLGGGGRQSRRTGLHRGVSLITPLLQRISSGNSRFSAIYAPEYCSQNSCLDTKFPTAANREFSAAISDHIHRITDCCALLRAAACNLKKASRRVSMSPAPNTSPSDTYRRGQVEWARWRMSTIRRPAPERPHSSPQPHQVDRAGASEDRGREGGSSCSWKTGRRGPASMFVFTAYDAHEFSLAERAVSDRIGKTQE